MPSMPINLCSICGQPIIEDSCYRSQPMPDQPFGISIPVEVTEEHDGKYWVCKAPEFRLVGAHADLNEARSRLTRMVHAQFTCIMQQESKEVKDKEDEFLTAVHNLLQVVRPEEMEEPGDYNDLPRWAQEYLVELEEEIEWVRNRSIARQRLYPNPTKPSTKD